MPLDPSIPLSFKPAVAAESPLATIGQLMQTRGVAAEVALRNAQTEEAHQRTQSLAAEAQQKNMDLRDSNYLQKAGLDPETHAALALGDTSRVSGHVQLKTEQAIQANALKVQGDRATLTKDDLANRNTAAKTVGESVAGLLSMTKDDGTPDFDRINASLPSTVTALTPAIKTLGLDPAKFSSQQITSADQLHALAAGMTAETAVNDKILAQKKTAADTAGTTATAAQNNQKTADAQYGQAVSGIAANPPKDAQAYADLIDSLPHGTASRMLQAMPIASYDPAKAATVLSTSAQTPEQHIQSEQAKAVAAEANARATETARHNRADESAAGGRLAVERERLAQTTGGAPLSADDQKIANTLAAGDFNPSDLSRIKNKEAIWGAALDINPNARQAYVTKKAFIDPQAKQSQNLGTISRIVEHLGRFDKNSESIGVAPGYAAGFNLTGDAAKLHEDAHAIASEMEKLVSGGVGTEGQVKAIQSGLSSTLPSIRKDASAELSQLIGGQYAGMNQSYKAGTGKDLPQDKFVSAHGREWLQKNGINVTGAADAPKPAGGAGSMIEALDGEGNIHHAPAGTALPAGWKLK